VGDRFKRAAERKMYDIARYNKAVVRRLFGFNLGEKTASGVPQMMDKERKDGTRILVPYVSAWCEA
jgi:hypothetical protein